MVVGGRQAAARPSSTKFLGCVFKIVRYPGISPVPRACHGPFLLRRCRCGAYSFQTWGGLETFGRAAILTKGRSLAANEEGGSVSAEFLPARATVSKLSPRPAGVGANRGGACRALARKRCVAWRSRLVRPGCALGSPLSTLLRDLPSHRIAARQDRRPSEPGRSVRPRRLSPRPAVPGMHCRGRRCR